MNASRLGGSGTALVIGESLIDAVERGGRRSELPGGSPMNVAIGLARLGRDVELATWYGRDRRGGLIDAHLAASGVRTGAGAHGAAKTSTATATLDEDGHASYVFDLEWSLPSVEIPEDCPVVHAGSLATVLDPGASVVHEALARARASATISYDPNIRPDLMPDPVAGRAAVERSVALADVVKASDEDLVWLGQGTDPLEVLNGWLALGPALVVMTCGAGDVVARTAAGLELRVHSSQVAVADTVGAGDSFMAGLVDGLWSAGLLGAARRGALARIDAGSLRAILQRCAAIAAITVSRVGADPPWRDELPTASGLGTSA